jgi:hypothetical protein
MSLVAPEGKIFLCLAPYCWGRSKKPGEAVAVARKNYPRLTKKPGKEMPYDLYLVNEDDFVDEAGNIRAHTPPQKILEVRHVGGQRAVKESSFNAPLPKV